MTLTLITASGRTLVLGTAPATRVPCAGCGRPAQVASEQDGQPTVAACAPCTETALRALGSAAASGLTGGTGGSRP